MDIFNHDAHHHTMPVSGFDIGYGFSVKSLYPTITETGMTRKPPDD
jgi:hypothetical protein